MEGRLGPNHTKVLILQCLLDGEWQLTFQIADACGRSLTNTSELLRRYRSQGLVCRVRMRDGLRGFAYRITNVGRDRYYYLLKRLYWGGNEEQPQGGWNGW